MRVKRSTPIDLAGQQSMTIFMLIAALTCFATRLSAQPYNWQHTTPLGIDSQPLATECVAMNPLSHGRTIFTASKQDTGIYRSDDGGQTWRDYNDGLQQFSTSRIMQIYCLESDTNIVLAVSSSAGVFRSTNGGRKWNMVVEAGSLGESISWHRESDALYYGQNFMGPVMRSLDHGATWQETGPASDEVVLCTIAVEPRPRKRILAGSGNGAIALSDEEGKNWRVVFAQEDPDELPPEVPKITWSIGAPNVVLATRWLSKKHSIIRSLDAGETWSALEPMPRAWALEIDQRHNMTGAFGPNRFWIGLFNRGLDPNPLGSVIETHDGGNSWLSTGIPDVEQVWMIKYDSVSQTLAAATDQGIFVTKASAGVAKPREDARVHFTNNPAREQSRAVLPESESICSLRLIDMAGRVALENKSATIDVAALANGLYMAEIVTSEMTYHLSLLVQH